MLNFDGTGPPSVKKSREIGGGIARNSLVIYERRRHLYNGRVNSLPFPSERFSFERVIARNQHHPRTVKIPSVNRAKFVDCAKFVDRAKLFIALFSLIILKRRSHGIPSFDEVSCWPAILKRRSRGTIGFFMFSAISLIF